MTYPFKCPWCERQVVTMRPRVDMIIKPDEHGHPVRSLLPSPEDILDYQSDVDVMTCVACGHVEFVFYFEEAAKEKADCPNWGNEVPCDCDYCVHFMKMIKKSLDRLSES